MELLFFEKDGSIPTDCKVNASSRVVFKKLTSIEHGIKVNNVYKIGYVPTDDKIKELYFIPIEPNSNGYKVVSYQSMCEIGILKILKRIEYKRGDFFAISKIQPSYKFPLGSFKLSLCAK